MSVLAGIGYGRRPRRVDSADRRHPAIGGDAPEGIGIILGIDRLLDMCRTVLNVTGDLAVAACVSNSGQVAGAGP